MSPGMKRTLYFLVLVLVMLVVPGGWLVLRTLAQYHQTKGGQLIQNVITNTNGINPEDIICAQDPLTNESSRAIVTQAIQHLQASVEYNSHLAHAYLLLGRAFCLLGEPKEAINACQKYINLRPENPLGYLELGFASITSGDPITAVKAWKVAGATAKDFLDRGNFQRNANQPQNALVSYQRAAALNPTWGQPWYFLGLLYSQMGDLQQAVSAFEHALQLSPSNIQAYYALGDLFQNRLDDCPKALEVYLAAIAKESFPVQAYLGIGACQERLSQQAAALATYQQATLVGSRTPAIDQDYHWKQVWPYYILGDYYLRSGQLNLATQAYDQALALDPQKTYAGWSMWGLGRIALQEKRYTDTQKIFSQAINLAENYYLRSQLNLMIAQAYMGQGDLITAIDFLRIAHGEHPDNQGLHRLLADTLRVAGRYADAIQEYQDYLVKWPGDPSVIQALQETQQTLQSLLMQK
jgi:tetratricopeptide (TPR) repeat protein